MHEVAVIFFTNRLAVMLAQLNFAFDDTVIRIAHSRAAMFENHPITFFEIADVARKRCQGHGVGSEEHFAVAVPDSQRSATAGADQDGMLAGEDDAKRERAFQAFQGARRRLYRRQALLE